MFEVPIKGNHNEKLKDELKPAPKIFKRFGIVYLIVFDRDKTQSYEPVCRGFSFSQKGIWESQSYHAERKEFIHYDLIRYTMGSQEEKR